MQTWQLNGTYTTSSNMQARHELRLAMSSASAESAVSLLWITPSVPSRIVNRTSAVAWVKCICPGCQAWTQPQCLSSTSGRGPARRWGRNTTATSHATTMDTTLCLPVCLSRYPVRNKQQIGSLSNMPRMIWIWWSGSVAASRWINTYRAINSGHEVNSGTHPASVFSSALSPRSRPLRFCARAALGPSGGR